MRSTIHGAQKSVVIMGDINHADRKQEEKEKTGHFFVANKRVDTTTLFLHIYIYYTNASSPFYIYKYIHCIIYKRSHENAFYSPLG